jgi:RimJ/RimL family protein N-acetyltransferase
LKSKLLVHLKNGEQISIKHISPHHATVRHRFWIELSLAQRGIINTTGEIDYHVDETEAKIADFLHYQRGIWLLAFNQHEEVIGEVDIIIRPLERIKHIGQLSIGTLPAYQRQGMATLLLELAIVCAHKKGLRRLELSVFANNHPARALYKKFGFSEEGVRKNYLLHQNDCFEDDILMALLLPRSPNY